MWCHWWYTVCVISVPFQEISGQSEQVKGAMGWEGGAKNLNRNKKERKQNGIALESWHTHYPYDHMSWLPTYMHTHWALNLQPHLPSHPYRGEFGSVTWASTH